MIIRKVALLLSVASGPLITVPAFAQSEAESSGSEEIIVTAQRREQALSDIGLSITALGSETLERRNVAEASDLAALVPGLSISNSGYATPIYTLRGVGINEPSVGSSSSVAVYVDEVPLAYPIISQGAALDLQRIEVLKGPQGTLYGQNSTGGAINYIANKPTDEFAAGIGATYGRFNRGNVEGYVSGPIAPTLKARIAGRVSFGDGWQQSQTSDRTLGRVENYTGRAIIEWEPADVIRLTANVNGWIDKSDTQASQLKQFFATGANVPVPAVQNAPIAPHNARAADWGPELDYGPFRRDDEFWQASLRGEVDVSDEVTLTSITAYTHFNRYQYSDTDGIGAAANVHQQQQATIRGFSQELRLSAQFGNGINWVVGVNYGKDKIAEDNLQILRDLTSYQNFFGFKGFGSLTTTSQDIENYAVFTNIDIPLTDQLTITGGIRLSNETRDFTGCAKPVGDGTAMGFNNLLNFFRSNAGLGPLDQPITTDTCYTFYGTPAGQAGDTEGLPLFTNGPANRRLKEDNAPWNIGVNFKPTERSLIYVRVSRGFKSGNFATIGLVDNRLYGPIVQEELTAYELGARFSLPSVFSIEGAIFQYDYLDKQLRSRIDTGPPFGNVSAQDNIPKSRIRGGEFSAVLRPVQGLSLSASGVYLDSEVKEYTGYTAFGTAPADLSGSPIPFTPKWSLNGDVNYSHPISAAIDGFIGVNVAYRSSTSSVFVPPGDGTLSVFDITAHTLVDGQVGIEDADGKWRAFLWGKNIFNKYYWTNTIKQGDIAARFAGMPATYGVTLSYDF
ncbi:TonB-dependent receptor [Sphingopyxis sp. 22461]|uniref:TonB-dependent receptor n=1 Tax=Sphingopyxis sp. 22461 TaxID=3453923 RepID=UPI003F843706